MNKEVLTFEIENCKFDYSKYPLDHKYDDKVKPLCIILPKINEYKKTWWH